jgi:hypothetical protein
MNTCRVASLAATLLLALAGPASAATVWDEALQGDFSGDGLHPTPLTVAPGSNLVRGTTGNAGQGIDRDYFSFVVPEGAVLSALMLLSNSTVSGGSSFIGLQAGPQLTVLPSGGGAEALIGYAHYGNDLVGTDLLPVISFTGALPAGAYAVWVQELGGPVEYGSDFQISAVPEPASALLALAGLLATAGRVRSARRRTSVPVPLLQQVFETQAQPMSELRAPPPSR